MYLSLINLYNTENETEEAEINIETYDEKTLKAFKDTRENTCKNLTISPEIKTLKQLEAENEENSEYYIGELESFFEFIVTRKINLIINSDNPILLVLAIFTALTILNLIVFGVNICICCEIKSKWNWCVKCNLIIFSIFLLGFIICGFIFAIFSVRIHKNIKEINCGMTILNDDLINGNPSFEQFKGFNAIATSLNVLNKNFESSKNADHLYYEEIRDSKLDVAANDAIDSLDPLCAECTGKKTPDGLGDSKTPFSVSTDFDNLYESAKIEFISLYSIATQIESKNSVYFDIVDPTNYDWKDLLNSIYSSLIKKMKSWAETVSKINKVLIQVDGYYSIVQMIYVSFSSMLMVFGVAIGLSLLKSIRLKKFKYLRCWRIIIFFFGFLMLLFTVYLLVVGLIVYVNSSFCQFLYYTSVSDEDSQSFIEAIFSIEIANMIDICVAIDGNGKFEELMSSFLKQGYTPFVLLTNFDEFLKLYSLQTSKSLNLQNDEESFAFLTYKELIEKYKTGEAVDHANVKSVLTDLNQLVSCNNREFILNSETCPSTCDSLLTTTSYTAPNCVDSQKRNDVESKVQNLHNYIKDTGILVDELLEKTYGDSTDPSTPNQLYKKLLSKISNAEGNLDFMKYEFDDLFKLLNNSTLLTGTNCRVARAEFHMLYSNYCSKFYRDFYWLFVLLIISGAFLQVIVYSLFFAVCFLPSFEENSLKYSKISSEISNSNKANEKLPQSTIEPKSTEAN